MVHHFRHDKYFHIKPVLIVSVILIILFVGGAVAMYYATKPQDIDFKKFYTNNKKLNPNVDDAEHNADGVVAKSNQNNSYS